MSEDAQVLTDRFLDALDYTTRLHAKQLRKGTATPYTAHLLGVCSLVLEDGGDEDEAIAALLHDAVEDQDQGGPVALLSEIRSRFGDSVAAIVDACTETLERPKPPSPSARPTTSPTSRTPPGRCCACRSADKLYNATTILRDYRLHGDELFSRFNPLAGRDGTVAHYTDLAALFSRRSSSPMAEELRRVVNELQTLVDAADAPT